MKWAVTLLLVISVGGAWSVFASKGREIKTLQEEITRVEDAGDPDGKASNMKSTVGSLEGEKTFSGILLTFLSAGLAGILFVIYLLPFFAQRVTHAIYDSAEMVEKDVMHDARVLVAQGDYHGAIEAFRQAAYAEPTNRLPWVEVVKIQKDNLGDPHAAIETIRYALESQQWDIDTAAYFLFRLSELYDESIGDRDAAVAVMRQVTIEFPRTRHSANAQSRLREWGVVYQDASEEPVPARVEPPPPMAFATEEDICYESSQADCEGADRTA